MRCLFVFPALLLPTLFTAACAPAEGARPQPPPAPPAAAIVPLDQPPRLQRLPAEPEPPTGVERWRELPPLRRPEPDRERATRIPRATDVPTATGTYVVP